MVQDPKSAIVERLKGEGFDVVRTTSPARVIGTADRLGDWLEAEFHGTMVWMKERRELRGRPELLWPDTRSIIVVGSNYGPEYNPLDVLDQREDAAISAYAQNRDYHDIMKGRLKQAAQWFASNYKCELKVFVDTAPVMEKPIAQSAGVGWQGKHTNLVSREYGSWLFLGEIFTTLELPEDPAEIDHCGSCSRCMDVCPTNAFPKPYVLDARKCISYLTIEHKGPIPTRFRAAIGNRVYGCDDCLSVCPWNKFAQVASEIAYKSRPGFRAPGLATLLPLEDAAFRTHFSQNPVKRIGRDRFIRNVLIAAGNSQSRGLMPQILALLSDKSALVRGAAVWALSRLMEDAEFGALKLKHYAYENDQYVLAEWRMEDVGS